MGLLGELNSKGITIILVTHEQEVAEYAKRILHFRDGLLVSDESPDSTTQTPAPADGAAPQDGIAL